MNRSFIYTHTHTHNGRAKGGKCLTPPDPTKTNLLYIYAVIYY